MSADRTSTAGEQWVSPAQFRAIEAGLRVIEQWSRAEQEAEAALSRALRAEPDPADMVIGLASVTRLLAIELAVATDRSERQVLRGLEARVRQLQRPHGQ